MTVVMSPVQLAAVLSDKSVTEAETLSNRLLGGGLGVLLGAVETDNELLARFEQNKRLIMSSTFKNLNVAESVISRAIYYNRANIKSLLGGGNRGGRLTIVYPAGQEIGYGFSRGSTQRISMRSVRIVIELKEYNGKPYYILTAFPTP
ncbi:RNase A-like domain-containing protein [Enterobacter cloacae]|uniref:RNase A-like domain-containing protein n=1 Tax=Enterobacter cloacae TaxID=550 RepID=UPI00338FDE79